MDTKIKICGLKRSEDIEYVNKYRPDYIGFVFFPPSSRFVTVEQAVQLRQMLDPEITAVGVFLDNSLSEILEVIQSGAVDMVQLHGETASELVKVIKGSTAMPVIEAFSIETADDVASAEASIADYVLLDHGPGGGGTTFDWGLLSDINKPWFLAGGLNPGNVTDALKICDPYAVDVSSGVETDKLKDEEKIKSFVDKVRRNNE